ncbi:MAG: hypothetical protein CM1200mP39_04060 [Dehalococcoidia bacterium]|nr:MAG: hypothetical protein CM1200mP39_04060 [Dehalococcoidia bacterium]
MEILAAGGQGALAGETRAGDNFTTELAQKSINLKSVKRSRRTCLPARVLAEVFPFPGFGTCEDREQQIEISAFASTPDASTFLRERVTGKASGAANMG